MTEQTKTQGMTPDEVEAVERAIEDMSKEGAVEHEPVIKGLDFPVPNNPTMGTPPPYPYSPDAPWGKNRKGKPRSEAQYKAWLKQKQRAKYQAMAHAVTRRCSQCNKLCSLEGQDPEVNSEDVETEMLMLDVDVILNSQCCDDEVARQNFMVEIDLTDIHECSAIPDMEVEDCPDCEGSGWLTEGGTPTQKDADDADHECEECDGTGSVEVEGDALEPSFEHVSTDLTYAEDYDNIIKRGPKAGQAGGYRYGTTLRGFEGTVTVHCNNCDTDFDVEVKELASASTFENSN